MKLYNYIGDRFFFPEHLSPHSSLHARHGMLMSVVARSLSQKSSVRILEIGSWCGTSSLVLAEATQRFSLVKDQNINSSVLCVDPWSRYIGEKDLSKNEHYQLMNQAAASGAAYDVFLHNTMIGSQRTGTRIDHIRGFSRNILPYLQDGFFDIIYIDGSHYYDDVLFDLQQADRLLRPGGFVCGDDLEAQLHEVNPEECAAGRDQDFIIDGETGGSYHPGVTLAVGERFSEVSCYFGFWVMMKTDGGYEQVTFDEITWFSPIFLSDQEKESFEKAIRDASTPNKCSSIYYPALVDSVGQYNIIRYNRKFYCVPMYAGPFDTAPEWMEKLRAWASIEATLDRARAVCRELTAKLAERQRR